MTLPHLIQLDDEDTARPRHPKFWLDDGSLIIAVQNDRYKVHRTLLYRHARALAHWSLSSTGASAASVGEVLVPQEVAARLRSDDMLALLEHLYHDVPLSGDTPFPRLASIVRVSSPRQLDLPAVHQLARALVETMFPSGPAPFRHPGFLQEALALAEEHDIPSIRKGLYYSLVTTSDFDMTGAGAGTASPDEQRAPHGRLSAEAARRCTSLMNSLIAHFTPILFTPAATPHMVCTDVFADTWMRLVISPALQRGGAYKPLETLEEMRGVDWGREGLCEGCVGEKRAEWRGEQEEVWRGMDGWLGLG